LTDERCKFKQAGIRTRLQTHLSDYKRLRTLIRQTPINQRRVPGARHSTGDGLAHPSGCGDTKRREPPPAPRRNGKKACAFLRAGIYGSRWTDFMFFELLLEVLFRFPLRYLFAIGYSLGYLALDELHHPYSVGIFKPTYSRERTLLLGNRPPLISHLTLDLPGNHPEHVTTPHLASPPLRLQVPSNATRHHKDTQEAGGIRSRANLVSLAATKRISIDFFSSP